MAFAVDVACEFVNLSVCVGVLNQILSNCRLNLVRNLIIYSLNLVNFKFPCSNFIVLLSLAWVALLKFDQANAAYQGKFELLVSL